MQILLDGLELRHVLLDQVAVNSVRLFVESYDLVVRVSLDRYLLLALMGADVLYAGRPGTLGDANNHLHAARPNVLVQRGRTEASVGEDGARVRRYVLQEGPVVVVHFARHHGFLRHARLAQPLGELVNMGAAAGN